jgi:hypothetical protein
VLWSAKIIIVLAVILAIPYVGDIAAVLILLVISPLGSVDDQMNLETAWTAAGGAAA